MTFKLSIKKTGTRLWTERCGYFWFRLFTCWHVTMTMTVYWHGRNFRKWTTGPKEMTNNAREGGTFQEAAPKTRRERENIFLLWIKGCDVIWSQHFKRLTLTFQVLENPKQLKLNRFETIIRPLMFKSPKVTWSFVSSLYNVVSIMPRDKVDGNGVPLVAFSKQTQIVSLIA